jgi:pSer/pThr/pTyr-binding forkhead associated (FHA) protein
VGKKGVEPPNEIIFGGRDMKPKHANIDIVEGEVFLTPLSPDCHLYVNGRPVREKITLKHMDRIIFGWNSVYLFKDKDHRREVETVKSKDVDWDFVKAEVAKFVDIDQSDTEDGGGCCQIF